MNYINDINYQYNDPKGLLLTDVYERAPGAQKGVKHKKVSGTVSIEIGRNGS